MAEHVDFSLSKGAGIGEFEGGNEQSAASLAVLTQLILLAGALIIGHTLTKYRVSWLGEAGVALLLGLFIGMVVRYGSISDTFRSWLEFKKEFFFIGLLPPIIFEAGFSLQVKPFVSNLGGICTMAFLGTCISTLLIGFTLWAAGALRLCIALPFIEALLYGAIVSATDPVTVLAVFQRLGADKNLYAMVFGESVLNDAVCIVLYRTLRTFLKTPVTAMSVFAGIGAFLAVFLGSMIIGALVGFGAAAAFKTKFLRSEHMPLEACLVIVFAFASYMLADGMKLSGIVAILFCGMVMAHYVRANLSRSACERIVSVSKVLSSLAETFVFVYIGSALFLEDQAWAQGLTWSFIAITLLSLAHSRAANVYGCTALVNYLRPPELWVPSSHKFMLWWSGLRGAIAFALSLEALEDLAEGHGRVMLTCSLFIVFLTVLFNGGSSASLLDRLHLRGEPHPGLHPSPSSPHLQPGSPAPPDVEAVQPSPNSVYTAGYASGAESGYTSGADTPTQSSQSRKKSRGLARVREMNKAGLMSKLEAVDKRYLQRIFVAEPSAGDVELSQVSHTGSAADTDVAHRSPSASPPSQHRIPAGRSRAGEAAAADTEDLVLLEDSDGEGNDRRPLVYNLRH